MKVEYIKKVGKIPIGRVAEVTDTKAKELIKAGIAKAHGGHHRDGENALTEKLKAEEIAKRIKAAKDTKPKKDKD